MTYGGAVHRSKSTFPIQSMGGIGYHEQSNEDHKHRGRIVKAEGARKWPVLSQSSSCLLAILSVTFLKLLMQYIMLFFLNLAQMFFIMRPIISVNVRPNTHL